MADVSQAGEDAELRERARRRGRAYQCLRCHYQEGRRVVDIKCRLEDHVLRNHVPLEEVPFFCSLCLYKCQQREQILSHFTSCKRHKDTAEKRGVKDNKIFMVESERPYKFGPLDLVQLSAEDSISHFMKQSMSRAAGESSSQVSVTLNQMFPDLFMEDGQTPAPVMAPPAMPVQAESLPEIQPPVDVRIETSSVSAAPATIQPIQQIAQMLATTPLGQLLNTQSSMVASMRENMAGTGESDQVEKQTVVPEVSVVREETVVGESSDATVRAREDVEILREPEEDEDITDQLLEDQDMSFSPPASKRMAEEDEDPLVPHKVQRTESDENVKGVDIEKVTQATVVLAVGDLTEMIRKNVAALDRMERFMVDHTCVMAKLADSVVRLNRAMEEHHRQEVLREEIRQEFDRRRDEERRREISRWRRQEERHEEEERRWADKRREQERRDRHGRQDRWREEKRRDKENQPKIKSVLVAVSGNNDKGRDESKRGESV